ncbi:putative F-box/LRR-repeat protein At3g28410 [Oryza brachyantha]|uniref:putative F-box/LRR-repeat protein At3g28410 n=1 Tax=Oryza brachyantha TaxID=4533 RepID=UPI001ADAB87D|nr:putative F-box/LRR-repeat protein At3g28410 [Oryza brachyantha]
MRNSSNGGGAGDGGDDDVDRISDLPEELIQSILIRLPSTAAAARTSVLSRRWRDVWTRLPSLSFTWECQHGRPDAIEAALAAYSAPTVNRLAISLGCPYPPRSAVAGWLEFAAWRVAGSLTLNFPRYYCSVDLPVCERATSISIHGQNSLRLPPVGSFAALTALTITGAFLEGGGFEDVLSSSRCPRLQRLKVRGVMLRTAADDDVSIRSGSLERLDFFVHGVARLEVAAPRLRCFRAALEARGDGVPEASIAAPMLEAVDWHGAFDAQRHLFLEAGRRLQRLAVFDVPTAALMRRFHIVDELVLSFGIAPGTQGYRMFLDATIFFARCEVLDLHMTTRRHSFTSAAFHLLNRSAGVRKLMIHLPRMFKGNKSCIEGCPCSLPDSCKTDKIQLDSLKEVEILGFRGDVHHLKFINLLLKCHVPILKKLYIKVSKDVKSLNKRTSHKIRRIIDDHPDIDVEFNLPLEESVEGYK